MRWLAIILILEQFHGIQHCQNEPNCALLQFISFHSVDQRLSLMNTTFRGKEILAQKKHVTVDFQQMKLKD